MPAAIKTDGRSIRLNFELANNNSMHWSQMSHDPTDNARESDSTCFLSCSWCGSFTAERSRTQINFKLKASVSWRTDKVCVFGGHHKHAHFDISRMSRAEHFTEMCLNDYFSLCKMIHDSSPFQVDKFCFLKRRFQITVKLQRFLWRNLGNFPTKRLFDVLIHARVELMKKW